MQNRLLTFIPFWPLLLIRQIIILPFPLCIKVNLGPRHRSRDSVRFGLKRLFAWKFLIWWIWCFEHQLVRYRGLNPWVQDSLVLAAEAAVLGKGFLWFWGGGLGFVRCDAWGALCLDEVGEALDSFVYVNLCLSDFDSFLGFWLGFGEVSLVEFINVGKAAA